jgi:hypothetical protein
VTGDPVTQIEDGLAALVEQHAQLEFRNHQLRRELDEEQYNTRLVQAILGQRDQEIRDLKRMRDEDQEDNLIIRNTLERARREVRALTLDVDKAREAVAGRDERIRELLVALRAARACLVEHVDCSEPECRAEIAKALAE